MSKTQEGKEKGSVVLANQRETNGSGITSITSAASSSAENEEMIGSTVINTRDSGSSKDSKSTPDLLGLLGIKAGRKLQTNQKVVVNENLAYQLFNTYQAVGSFLNKYERYLPSEAVECLSNIAVAAYGDADIYGPIGLGNAQGGSIERRGKEKNKRFPIPSLLRNKPPQKTEETVQEVAIEELKTTKEIAALHSLMQDGGIDVGGIPISGIPRLQRLLKVLERDVVFESPLFKVTQELETSVAAFKSTTKAADDAFNAKRSGFRRLFHRKGKLEEERKNQYQWSFSMLHGQLEVIWRDAFKNYKDDPEYLSILASELDEVARSAYTSSIGHLSKDQIERHGKVIGSYYQDSFGKYQYDNAATLLEGAKGRLKERYPEIEQLTLRDVQKTVEARMEKEELSGRWEQHVALADTRETLTAQINAAKEAGPKKVTYVQAAELLRRTKQRPAYQEDKAVQRLTMLDIRTTVKKRLHVEGVQEYWGDNILLDDIKQLLQEKRPKEVKNEQGTSAGSTLSHEERERQRRREEAGKDKEDGNRKH